MKKFYCFIALLLPFASYAQCPTGDINLSSQSEINSFATDYPGCVSLPGNLYIVDRFTDPDITDLSPLSVITSVTAGIRIEGIGGLTSLNGLQNIISVGGDIEIFGNPLLTEITALSKITTVPGTLTISENPALTTLAGLQNLTSVGNELNIRYNDALTTMGSLTLTSVGDDITIESNPLLTDLQGLQNIVTVGDQLEVTGNDALTSLQALSGITTLNDNLEISSNPLLTSLAGIENITVYGGDLIISDNASLADLSSLSDITEIGGTLQISESPLLTDLKALQNITSVGGLYIGGNTALTTLGDLKISSAGSVTIENNDLLTDLKGLENIITLKEGLAIIDNDRLANLTELSALTELGYLIIANNIALSNIQALSKITSLSELQIAFNSALTDLQGLENVTTIQGQVVILQNQGLTSLRGLDGITTVDSTTPQDLYVIIFGNPDLVDISNLSALTRINGSLVIAGNTSLVSLTGLDNLESLGPYANLYISDNPLLKSLAGIGKFENVNAINIQNNASLTDLSGLETLGSVTDSFFILENDALTSLKGLNNLTTIGGELILDSNPKLSNLNDLNSLSLLLQSLTIINNENLGTCAVAGICAFLQTSSPDVVTIFGNQTGCNSQQEVEISCSVLPVTLVEFTTEKKEKFVQIRWSTSSEINSSHFEIQHSLNSGGTWQVIGNVQAGRESNKARNYEFIHMAPSKGDNLYRLKMIDLDETFAFSTIWSVIIDQDDEFSVYPNPVADQLMVEAGNVMSVGKLQIYNAAGKMLMSDDVNLSGKPYQVETAVLPAGIYTIQILHETGKRQMQKFIKLGR